MDLTQEQLLIIRRNDFLARLQPSEYELLNIEHNIIVAERNAYLYFDGQNHNKLYFVKEGYVRIGIVNDDGSEFVKDILQPGDVFGQITLERGSLNGEFAQAHRKDAMLCAFTVEDFQALLRVRPELAVIFSKTVGEKLRRVENRLLNLLQRDVRTRVLYFFWTLLPKVPRDNEAAEIPNYLTHEDIARLTGTSRQTVTSLFNQLAAEGLIKVNRKSISISSVKWLQREAKVS